MKTRNIVPNEGKGFSIPTYIDSLIFARPQLGTKQMNVPKTDPEEADELATPYDTDEEEQTVRRDVGELSDADTDFDDETRI